MTGWTSAHDEISALVSTMALWPNYYETAVITDNKYCTIINAADDGFIGPLCIRKECIRSLVSVECASGIFGCASFSALLWSLIKWEDWSGGVIRFENISGLVCRTVSCFRHRILARVVEMLHFFWTNTSYVIDRWNNIAIFRMNTRWLN